MALDDEDRNELWRGIGVGLPLGTGVGIITGDLALWMAIGSAAGIALGTILSRRQG